MKLNKEMTPYYRERLKEGLHYQDFVMEELYKIGLPLISYSSKEYQHTIGENKAGIEIKKDNRWRETGNVYIEMAEKSNPENLNWIPSGIYRKDNTWLYLIGDEGKMFIFSKKQLVCLHKKKTLKEVETPTSRGFLLPVEKAEQFYALKIIQPMEMGNGRI